MSARNPVKLRRLRRLVAAFPRLRVLVVGDLMLDQFVWGDVERISPEAPVPVVRQAREEFRAGGAGNVVSNVCALGGRAVAAGIVGRDEGGRRLVAELRSLGARVDGVLATGSAPTIRKTRIIAHHQQVVRVDREGATGDGRALGRLADFVLRNVRRFDALLISDYGKGTVSPELLARLAEARRRGDFLCLIDPKRRNFAHYRGATLVKPNRDEAAAAAGIEIEDQASLRAAGRRLLEMWDAQAVLISRGEAGMTLFRREGGMRHFPTAAREVYDVTGAGDTVLAACALALAAGGTFEEATVLANQAAGIVVGKVGTATVSAAELRAALRSAYP